MKRLRNLESISKDDVSLAGGKGASLGEMARAGFTVPPGFVVLTDAFEYFLGRTGLRRELDKMPREPECAALIGEKILKTPMPPDLLKEIMSSFRELGLERVAVRSSAVSEDGSESAWAGQFQSFLGVDESHLIESIKKCWASISEARALCYGEKRRIAAGILPMAVVIQKMVPAQVSGIAFSHDPLHQSNENVIIEAGYGLGEAVVSGQISPDRYIIARNPMRISEKTVGSQTRMVAPIDRGGTEWRDIPGEEALSQKLSDEKILGLAGLLLSLEKYFEYPVDVEWAMDGENLFIKQCRPITSRRPDPEIPKGLWSNVNLAEVLSGVNPPLVSSLVMGIVTPAFCKLFGLPPGSEIIGDIKGRLYFNVLIIQKGLKDIAGEAFDITSFFGGSGGVKKALPEFSLRGKIRFVLFILKAFAHSFWWNRRLNQQAGIVRSCVESFARQVSGTDDPVKLLALTDKIYIRLREWMTSGFIGILYQISFYFLYLALCRKWLSEKGSNVAHELYASGGTELQLIRGFSDLWKIGRIIAGNAILKQQFLGAAEPGEVEGIFKKHPDVSRAWQIFIQDHGHRAVNELNFALPRWCEDPSFIISVLKNYLEAPDELDPEQRIAQLEEGQAQKFEKLTKALPRWKEAFLTNFLRRGRKGINEREHAKAELIRMFVPLRASYLKIGAHLVSQNLLDRQEDIFMFSRSELRETLLSGADRRALIRERNEAYREYALQEMPEFFADPGIIADLPPASAAETPSVLKGLAVSHGTVKGTARVILDIGEISHLRPGDILVTDHTDPGWTPVFVTVSGVITNIGGLLSHAAIVAREYGLPAVANVKEATRLITDGQTVLLDGDAGTITLL